MSSKPDSARNRLREIHDLKMDRHFRFFKQFLSLFTVVIGYQLFCMIVVLVAAFQIEWWFSSETIEVLRKISDYMAMSCGFVFAELVRRATVNEKTDDLRPYTWRELFTRWKHPSTSD